VLEQIPLAAVERLTPVEELSGIFLPGRGLWWPGCLFGRRRLPDLGQVHFFATRGRSGMILVSTPERHLAISPPDTLAFRQAFIDATRLGSLEPIPQISYQPDFLAGRLWDDRLARYILLLGFAISLSLFAYLAFRAPSLPAQVPFGFGPAGEVQSLAPPGRLLLLPIASGGIWMLDLLFGAWLYRRPRQQGLAYVLWGTAIVVGGLLWGATLHLLAAG
jgi:hypothetical protein